MSVVCFIILQQHSSERHISVCSTDNFWFIIFGTSICIFFQSCIQGWLISFCHEKWNELMQIYRLLWLIVGQYCICFFLPKFTSTIKNTVSGGNKSARLGSSLPEGYIHCIMYTNLSWSLLKSTQFLNDNLWDVVNQEIFWNQLSSYACWHA